MLSQKELAIELLQLRSENGEETKEEDIPPLSQWHTFKKNMAAKVVEDEKVDSEGEDQASNLEEFTTGDPMPLTQVIAETKELLAKKKIMTPSTAGATT